MATDTTRTIPYSCQCVDDDDACAVIDVFESGWLTTGPCVRAFEREVARALGASHGVAVSSGTAALHTALLAAGVGPGDEVIVPAMTFVATASAVVMCGARPVVVDVHPQTLLVDPDRAQDAITEKTRAIVAVDYAGQPCDYEVLHWVAQAHGLTLIADACHSLGASYHGTPVGRLADLTALSFHPVKAITTGEGGMVLTESEALASRIRSLRNHGIDRDHHDREDARNWEYDVREIGFNYRITDLQCALGLSQLGKLERFIARRREIAAEYDGALADLDGIVPLETMEEIEHAYHLYVVRVDPQRVAGGRDGLFRHLAAKGIGGNVHYKPVHLLSAIADRFDTMAGQCPNAEAAFGEILSLPIHPRMDDDDVKTVIRAVQLAPKT